MAQTKPPPRTGQHPPADAARNVEAGAPGGDPEQTLAQRRAKLRAAQAQQEAAAPAKAAPAKGPAPGRAPGVPPKGPAQAPGGAPAKAAPAAPANAPPPQAKPAAPPPQPAAVAPPAQPTRFRGRHWAVLLSFVLCVICPTGVVAWYLWERAVDQYASTVGFSVRKEEVGSAIELLGGITELSGSSSSDTDILYEFIQSQKLVAEVDRTVDLRAIWSKPENDPYFAYDPPGTIEDLMAHWERLVRIYYDSGSGLIEVQARAFTPEDATAIAQAIYDESSEMINALSDIAREDAIRYARDELSQAEDRLREARAAVTSFRNRTQMVDPSMDTANQSGLLGNLQGQLSAALIEVQLLSETAAANDPRLSQAQRRVRVIEDMIAQERRKLGMGEGAEQGRVFADLVGEFERLTAEREFAERSYTGALASYDGAVAEARRQSRYLAAHVLPTRAEKSEYPERWLLLGLFSLFVFLAWAIVVLVSYSLRDRR